MFKPPPGRNVYIFFTMLAISLIASVSILFLSLNYVNYEFEEIYMERASYKCVDRFRKGKALVEISYGDFFVDDLLSVDCTMRQGIAEDLVVVTSSNGIVEIHQGGVELYSYSRIFYRAEQIVINLIAVYFPIFLFSSFYYPYYLSRPFRIIRNIKK